MSLLRHSNSSGDNLVAKYKKYGIDRLLNFNRIEKEQIDLHNDGN